jgi:hypothetical protein
VCHQIFISTVGSLPQLVHRHPNIYNNAVKTVEPCISIVFFYQ